MAYSRPRNPKKPPAEAPEAQQSLGLIDAWDAFISPLTGLWEGGVGKNRKHDQYVRERARKRRGRSTPGKGWLGRITGR